jgi:ABC-2 type transport system ATP-binding protein
MSDVMIEARSLTKKYGNFEALRRASFELRRGEILGFLGPNGAGKSTTMKILTCFIAPTAGRATINGHDIWDAPLEVRRSIGYLPETNPLYGDMFVYDYLTWAATMRELSGSTAKQRIHKVIDEVGLHDVLGKQIQELSKGFRQRVGLAQALIHEPPILILDEPLSGLDPNQASEVRQLIKDIGEERTVILSTHNLAEVRTTCQRVLIINKGRIVADDTPETLASAGGQQGSVYRLSVLSGASIGADGEGSEGRSDSDLVSAASAAFRSVRGVEAVHEQGESKGELRFEIVSNNRDDLRAELFRAAVRADVVLVGLQKREVDLEQVFRDLTIGADADAATEDEEE